MGLYWIPAMLFGNSAFGTPHHTAPRFTSPGTCVYGASGNGMVSLKHWLDGSAGVMDSPELRLRLAPTQAPDLTIPGA